MGVWVAGVSWGRPAEIKPRACWRGSTSVLNLEPTSQQSLCFVELRRNFQCLEASSGMTQDFLYSFAGAYKSPELRPYLRQKYPADG